MALIQKVAQMMIAAFASFILVMAVRALLFADPLHVLAVLGLLGLIIAILGEVAEYLDRREVHKIREEYEEQASDQIDRE